MSVAQAQEVDTVAQAEDDDAVQETIVVTGSRLSQANITSSSPVTTVDSEAFAIRGTLDTIDLVNTLPGVFAGQSNAVGNGASGTSTLNLRGLGATRTLVLANGKRLPPGAPDTYAADVNLIPSALVERVEIVTGGASAVYGSDAVGGVANFILRDDFEGVEFDVQYGFNQTNNNDSLSQAALDAAPAEEVISGGLTDNPTYNVSGIIGANLDSGKGNVTAYFSYLSIDGVLQNNRDFSRCSQFQLADSALCVGSGAGPFPATFFVPATDAAGNPLAAGTPSGTFSLEDDGTISAGSTNPFNFAPLNPLQRPTERFNAGFSGHYEVNDHLEFYSDFGFTQNSTASQIAPSASFSGAADTFGCDNPFLSAQQVEIFCTNRGFGGDDIVTVGVSRRVVESGPRTTSFTQSNFRVVGGFRGEVIPGIEYDTFGQVSETERTLIQTNQVTATALEQSIDVVTDPATGLPICRAELQGDVTGCIPFNVFDPTATNEGIGAFLDTPSLNTGAVRQLVFGSTLTLDGNEFGIVSPFATSGVQALVGWEYREDRLRNQADATNQQGLLVGAGGPVLPTDAETEVLEFYGEIQIPLVQDIPFVEELTFSGAYRYSDYSSEDILRSVEGGDFGISTFSAGLAWSPVEDVRLRGQFQRAIRAPNIFELFAPNNTGLVGISDPCSGPLDAANPGQTINGGTLADCINTGITAAQFGAIPPDSGQLNTFAGGNIALQPEESDTFTIGAVIQPRFVEGLTISVDYFDISVDGFVGTVPAATILTDCLADAASELCGFINRSPLDGSLTQDGSFIELNLQNIASVDTNGLDFQIDYGIDAFGFGEVGINYVSTYLFELASQPIPANPPLDCLGIFDDECGGPSFDYRHNLTLSYDTPYDVRLNLLWRYFSGVDRIGTADITAGTFQLFAEEFPDANIRGDTLSAVNYIDLAAFYDVNEHVELRFGVNNVFDKTPPIVDFDTSGADGNTFSGLFTSTGRFIFVGAKLNF